MLNADSKPQDEPLTIPYANIKLKILKDLYPILQIERI